MAKQLETRAKALAGMTKAELVKTIKALDKRMTKLLNELSAKDKLLNSTLNPNALGTVEVEIAAPQDQKPFPRLAEWSQQAEAVAIGLMLDYSYVAEPPIDQANPPEDDAGKFPWETDK